MTEKETTLSILGILLLVLVTLIVTTEVSKGLELVTVILSVGITFLSLTYAFDGKKNN